jgi:hypothetical protein
MVSKKDLVNLTSSQLRDLIKEIKNKLNLGIAGKNKEELVETIYNLHNKNSFYGKKLLSYDDSGHIKLPERKIKEPNLKKIEQKKVKKLKQTAAGQLKLLQAEFAKINNPSEGQIEAFKAKLRKIKKNVEL